MIAQKSGASDAVVVLGGLFDSVSGLSGANDNASGAAVLLDIAEQLAAEICVGMGTDHLQWALAGPNSLAGIDLSNRSITFTGKRPLQQASHPVTDPVSCVLQSYLGAIERTQDPIQGPGKIGCRISQRAVEIEQQGTRRQPPAQRCIGAAAALLLGSGLIHESAAASWGRISRITLS